MSTQSEHSMPIVPVSSDIPTMNNQNFQENINHVPTEAEVSPSRPESPEIAENFEPEDIPFMAVDFEGSSEKISTGDRKKALQAIQDKNYETASDDMYSFHCKIARENGIAISGWSMIIEDPE
ncbi:10703_t:CDS:2 [Entrophospora sp. SA101]|nr:10703_t:CDS:2 [Entrophospora sp. SA101]